MTAAAAAATTAGLDDDGNHRPRTRTTRSNRWNHITCSMYGAGTEAGQGERVMAGRVVSLLVAGAAGLKKGLLVMVTAAPDRIQPVEPHDLFYV